MAGYDPTSLEKYQAFDGTNVNLVAVIPFSHLPTSKIKPPWKLLCIGAVTARQQLRLVKRNTNEPDGFISLHQKDNGCSEDLFPRLWRVYYWADRDKHSHPHSHTLTAVDLLWTTSRCMSSSLSSSLKPGANPASYKDQSKHTQRLFQPSSAETRLKNPAREPIVACFCAKTNIWQIQTEEQSAAKSPKRCKDLGCRCLGNMFGLERELKVCETRLVFILMCVSTEWLAEPGWKLIGLFFRLLPKVHDRIGEGWTVDQVVQLYQSWTSHYLDPS